MTGSGHGSSSTRLKDFDLGVVISFVGGFMYQIQHTHPLEETYHSNEPFFTNSSNELVFRPWLPNIYSPKCVERLSGNSYARASRLAMSLVIAA